MSYQPTSTAPKVRPGALWYWLGALAILAGLAAFVGMLLMGIRQMSNEVDNFTPFTVPADGVVATVDFVRPGGYTLYFQYAPGASSSQQAVPGDLKVKITGVDAKDVPFTKGGTEISYSLSGKAGRSAGTFSLPNAGKYDIQVTGGADRAPFTLAVGRGVLAKLGRTVAIGVAIGAVLGLLGLITIILTATKRRRAKRVAAIGSAAWAGAGAPTIAGVPAPVASWPPTAAPAPLPPVVPAPPVVSVPLAPAPVGEPSAWTQVVPTPDVPAAPVEPAALVPPDAPVEPSALVPPASPAPSLEAPTAVGALPPLPPLPVVLPPPAPPAPVVAPEATDDHASWASPATPPERSPWDPPAPSRS